MLRSYGISEPRCETRRLFIADWGERGECPLLSTSRRLPL